MTAPKGKIKAAYTILCEETPSLEKFEAVRKLISGLNPKIDEALSEVSEAASKVDKLQKGELLELSTEFLPEESDEEKKRKRAIIFFIKTWKDLASEVERVKLEFERTNQKSTQEQILGLGKIFTFFRGPAGIITLVAIVIVAGATIVKINSSRETGKNTQLPTQKTSRIQVISYQNKKIPLDELQVREGPDCNSPHYHAKNNSLVTATDGTKIPDPGACAFGKVEEVKIEEIE